MSAIADRLTGGFIDLAERGLVPDTVLRAGIRKLCSNRLKELSGPTLDVESGKLQAYVDELNVSPIAVHTREANTQHYEVPTEFYLLTLGKNLKYSSAFYPPGVSSLDQAEDFALAETLERAEITNGMKILELGCGWGSLTLAMARKYPSSKITAISNSKTQREFILGKAASEGLTNLEVLTRNVADGLGLEASTFDRVVSVEMFEHMKNYGKLLAEISGVLKPGGKLFVHIFTHKRFAYPFETDGEDNWMGKYFFTGGQMPSHDLLLFFQDHLSIEHQWSWNGTHYSKTANGWLENQDKNRTEIMRLFRATYGNEPDAIRWFNRWRIFFMSCAELFGYSDGNEWGVSHYRFIKRSSS